MSALSAGPETLPKGGAAERLPWQPPQIDALASVARKYSNYRIALIGLPALNDIENHWIQDARWRIADQLVERGFLRQARQITVEGLVPMSSVHLSWMGERLRLMAEAIEWNAAGTTVRRQLHSLPQHNPAGELQPRGYLGAELAHERAKVNAESRSTFITLAGAGVYDGEWAPPLAAHGAAAVLTAEPLGWEPLSL